MISYTYETPNDNALQELAERDEEEFQADVAGSIIIPGQRKVVGIGLIPPSEIAKAVRPFPQLSGRWLFMLTYIRDPRIILMSTGHNDTS